MKKKQDFLFFIAFFLFANNVLCSGIIETGSLPADQRPDSEMNHRISGIICQSPADRVFQSGRDTGRNYRNEKSEGGRKELPLKDISGREYTRIHCSLNIFI
jgi:hypothetical protein